VFHNDIRGRFERNDPDVVAAMLYWADLTDEVRDCLLAGDRDGIGPLLNANFDRRRSIYKISQGNLKMVETARSVGASAKFSGSGGAIVGAYRDESMFQELEQALGRLKIKVIKPRLCLPHKQ
ncbi:MAG: GHMP kinase, partial [Kiritimatiellia bacterium]